jgi:hypothetical protein
MLSARDHSSDAGNPAEPSALQAQRHSKRHLEILLTVGGWALWSGMKAEFRLISMAGDFDNS